MFNFAYIQTLSSIVLTLQEPKSTQTHTAKRSSHRDVKHKTFVSWNRKDEHLFQTQAAENHRNQPCCTETCYVPRLAPPNASSSLPLWALASGLCLRPNSVPHTPEVPGKLLNSPPAFQHFFPVQFVPKREAGCHRADHRGLRWWSSPCPTPQPLRHAIKPVVVVSCYFNQSSWEFFQAHSVRQNATRVEQSKKESQ